jgi:hypothetical protein
LISAPEQLAPVQIDSIMKLISTYKSNDNGKESVPTPTPTLNQERIKLLSEVESDPIIKPCLREIILNKEIRQLEDVSAHEHKGRVAIATELLCAGYSDAALHEFFSRLQDYDEEKTTYQINQILRKFVEGKAGKSWRCETLRDTKVIPVARCKGCPRREPPSLEDLTKITGQIDVLALDGSKTGEKKAKHTLSPSKAAQAITQYMSLCLSDLDQSNEPTIWYYNHGGWQPKGEREIKKLLRETCGDLTNTYYDRETLNSIRAKLAEVKFNEDSFRFPLLDGVVDLKISEFRPARPVDYLTFKYNARYNQPNADWRLFLWALCSSLPDPRDVITAIDILTSIALRVPFDVIVHLIGGGANGKGVFEKVLLALFTDPRTSALTLEELKGSRFGPDALFDVDLWLVSEVENAKDATAALKKISSGEYMDSDVKYGKTRRKGIPHAKPILDSNKAFDWHDDTHGRIRRR